MQKIFLKYKIFDKAKEIYFKLGKGGEAFFWHSSIQIAKILIQEKKKTKL